MAWNYIKSGVDMRALHPKIWDAITCAAWVFGTQKAQFEIVGRGFGMDSVQIGLNRVPEGKGKIMAKVIRELLHDDYGVSHIGSGQNSYLGIVWCPE